GGASAPARTIDPARKRGVDMAPTVLEPEAPTSVQESKVSGISLFVIDSPLATEAPGKVSDTLTITDNRTGKSYEVPITDGTIKALDLRKIKTGDDDFGLMTYDPAFMNTASCRSSITFIDGDKGILEYRGYPIEQLAEKSTYLETAFLLLYGQLPSKDELASWTHD